MNYEEIFIEEKTESINTIGITDNISENYLREICQEYANNYGGQLESQVMLDRSETSCEKCEYWMHDEDDLPNKGYCKMLANAWNNYRFWSDRDFYCKHFEPKLSEGTT